MEFWIKAAQLLLSLSILVVLHEFGHYIPARIFKTRVEKFYLFFNYKFSLFKKKIGETEWGIGWIPLGGYVKIAGMIDESMDKEQMAKPPEPWEFRSKPAWQRLIIMLGGVIVNMLLGMIIYIFVIFAWGSEEVDLKKMDHGMALHPYLEQFGVHSGDKIMKINGKPVDHTNAVGRDILLRGGRDLTVMHENGSTEIIKLPETIDYDLFKAIGNSPIAQPRHRNTTISGIAVTEKVTNQQFRAGDQIYKVDGKELSAIDVKDKNFRSKGHKVSFGDKKEQETVVLSKEEFKILLWSSPAFSAGLQNGDKIISVDSKPIEYYDDIISALFHKSNKRAIFNVERKGEILELKTRVSKAGTVGFGTKAEEGYLDQKAFHKVTYSFGESIGEGISKGYWTLSDYASQMKYLFTEKGANSMGGFGAIGSLFAPTWDWQVFWERTALISIILAFMNILPIPALDGGHVVFLLYEMITGREAPEKVLEIAQYIGFFLILALVLFSNGNDIYKAIFGG